MREARRRKNNSPAAPLLLAAGLVLITTGAIYFAVTRTNRGPEPATGDEQTKEPPLTPAAVGKDPPARKPDPPRTVEEVREVVVAGGLWGDYADNAAAQDAKYKGRVITVKGEVHGITPDGDGYTLGLKTLESLRQLQPPGLLASFPASALAALADLKPGQTVRVRGYCAGMRESAAGPRMPNRTFGHVVTLERCELIPSPDGN
jgi:hypothetical protein